ncbi:hypothetical protein ANANG_G00170860 [Anguilla anguilla]|uniref:Uncharacterized protein n=1 Tax=Anguilla anguilla TaxID=7936 RepID=A0A9D3M4Q3_ANGAN|nr:hypothetical protein ANANG_G00170860 [Anguilla anguilla]
MLDRCIMGHTRFLCILLLALSLASVSGHPEDTLEEINDLVGNDFGHNFPRHGLNLLYWFSSEYITFDNNDNMQPATDPKQGVYGFHKYQNREDLLPSLCNQIGYDYYTVGNLLKNENLPQGERLPNYVLEEFRQSMTLNSRNQRNRDRIIVRRTPDGAIDLVYITQHHDINSDHGSEYDLNNTYRISKDLIKAVRNLMRESFLQHFA